MKRYSVHFLGGSEADWSAAARLTDFSLPWERTRPQPTEFRALLTQGFFHFRFDCAEREMVLAEGRKLRERVVNSDRVEIYLATSLDLDPYYCLEIDPRGEVLAYRAGYYRRFDQSWDCAGLEIHAELRPDGYSVEGRIPLATLNDLSLVSKDGTMLAGLYRADLRRRSATESQPAWVAWVGSSTLEPDFHVPSSFGVFELGTRVEGAPASRAFLGSFGLVAPRRLRRLGTESDVKGGSQASGARRVGTVG